MNVKSREELETTGRADGRPHAGLSRSVDLLAMLRIIAESWFKILSISLFFAIAFGAYSWRSPRIYEAESLVTVVDDPASGGGGASGAARLGALASVVGLNLSGSQERRSEYIALLSSRRLIADLITKNDLLTVLYSSRWDEENQSWKKVWYSDHTPTIDNAIDEFRNRLLEVAEDKRTGLVVLRIQWRDPKKAAEWATQLIDLVNSHVRATTIADANKSIEFLNKELGRVTEIQVRESIFRLIETNMGRAALANAQEQYAFRIIDPPRVADPDRYVRPRPLLAILGGLVVGFLFGAVILFYRHAGSLLVASRT